MDAYVLITGLLIFIARVFDVSIGTIRTIVTVQGKMVIAFFLGIIEVVLWIVVVGAVINEIRESPILILFYSVGFATGNVVGIIAERELAFGPVILKVITGRKEAEITDLFRKYFLNATRFRGEGFYGPVTEISVVCHRRDLRVLLPAIRQIDEDAFFVTELAREVSKDLKPVCSPQSQLSVLINRFRQACSGFVKGPHNLGLLVESGKDGHIVVPPLHTPLTGWRARFKKK